MFSTPLLLSLAGWLLAGFLGGVHCLGMCGGLAAALGLQSQGPGRLSLLLAANLGRILSYTLIGALLGGLSGLLAWLPQAARVQNLLYLVSLVLVFLLGLYLAGWSPLLTRLERLGGPLWRCLQPWMRRLLPLRSLPAALLAGAIWGWLPCGLVYTAATGALATGAAWKGALVLMAFGLGTLPNLMAMGMAANQLQRLRQHRGVRWAAGGLLMVYAGIELFRFLLHQAS